MRRHNANDERVGQESTGGTQTTDTPNKCHNLSINQKRSERFFNLIQNSFFLSK